MRELLARPNSQIPAKDEPVAIACLPGQPSKGLRPRYAEQEGIGADAAKSGLSGGTPS